MILVFDTETSNLPQKNLPLDHPDQCRVIQLAAMVLDYDFNEISSFSALIDIPDSINISPGASAAHGITKEKCWKYGIDIRIGLNLFSDFIRKSDIIVGHNVNFNFERINNELALTGIKNGYVCESYCTMHIMTEICRLPGKYGKFKWPKLIEAYRHCFGKDFNKAHDALADVRATGEIFKWLVDNKHVILKRD